MREIPGPWSTRPRPNSLTRRSAQEVAVREREEVVERESRVPQFMRPTPRGALSPLPLVLGSSDFNPRAPEPPKDIAEEEQGQNISAAGAKEPKKFPSSTAPAEFQIVYNSSHARNVTAHVELEVTDDIDDELEEFSRLTRIGSFREAKVFFDEHLRTVMDKPYVFVQYAEMLLRQGDYKSIRQLDDSRVFPDATTGHDEAASDTYLQTLRNNWQLIEAATLCFTQHEMSPIRNKMFETLVTLPENMDLGSTEIRIITLQLFIVAKASEAADPRREHLSILDDDFDWHALYQLLLQQGRVWDFKDVFIEACSVFQTSKACRKVFGLNNPFECMLDDWTTTEPDESTLLALLDIFASMALNSTRNTFFQVDPFTKTCLEYTDKIGNTLLREFPETFKSRPVLLWTITKSAISLRTQKDEHDLENPLQFKHLWLFPGMPGCRDKSCFELPYYLPIRQENPGWQSRLLPPQCNKLLEMALDTAKEHDDFEIQALCLRELAMRSPRPSRVLVELADLQKTKQLDMDGYLSTCLTRYLTYMDEHSARELRMDLSETGWWGDPSDLLDPRQAAARDIIQLALSPSTRQSRTPSLRAGLRYYDYVDERFRVAMDEYFPGTEQASLSRRVIQVSETLGRERERREENRQLRERERERERERSRERERESRRKRERGMAQKLNKTRQELDKLRESSPHDDTSSSASASDTHEPRRKRPVLPIRERSRDQDYYSSDGDISSTHNISRRPRDRQNSRHSLPRVDIERGSTPSRNSTPDPPTLGDGKSRERRFSSNDAEVRPRVAIYAPSIQDGDDDDEQDISGPGDFQIGYDMGPEPGADGGLESASKGAWKRRHSPPAVDVRSPQSKTGKDTSMGTGLNLVDIDNMESRARSTNKETWSGSVGDWELEGERWLAVHTGKSGSI